MIAILTSFVVMSLHWLSSVIVPGLLGELLWLQRQQRASTAQSSMVRILLWGLLYLMGQTLVVVCALALLHAPASVMVAIKYAADAAVLFVLLACYGSAAAELGLRLARALASPWSLTLGLIALVHGLYVMLRCPYTLDSEMVLWTGDIVAGWTDLLANRQGSPMFLGLTYFPSYLLSSWYPVPTVTASMKPMLCLIAALAVSRFAHLLPLRYPGLSALVGYCVLVSSFYGFYGLFMTGKQSAFGITFLALMVAELLDDSNHANWPQRVGIALAAALGLGSIALPYSLVILATFLILAAPRTRPFAFAFWPLVWSCVPLAVCIGAVTRRPMPKIVFFILVAGAVCLLLHHVDWHRAWRRAVAQPWFRLLPLAVIAICIAMLCQLMPVKYAFDLPPLDGKTTFFPFLLTYESVLKLPVVIVGFLGVVAALLVPDFSRRPGLQAFAMFPFLALVPTLYAAHLPPTMVPFRPIHLWDLAKDVPNWCYGFYFAVFVMVAIEVAVRAARQIESFCWRKWAFRPAGLDLGGVVVLVVLVLGGLMAAAKQRSYSKNSPVCYADFGGHNDATLVAIVERFTTPGYLDEHRLWRASSRHRFHITPRCRVNSTDLRHYRLHASRGAIDPADEASLDLLRQLGPACVVARRDEWGEAMRTSDVAIAVTEVDRLTPEISVFVVRSADKSSLRLSNVDCTFVR